MEQVKWVCARRWKQRVAAGRVESKKTEEVKRAEGVDTVGPRQDAAKYIVQPRSRRRRRRRREQQ